MILKEIPKNNKDTEDEIDCPYGDEECVQDDDFELLCDDCRQDRAADIADQRNDLD